MSHCPLWMSKNDDLIHIFNRRLHMSGTALMTRFRPLKYGAGRRRGRVSSASHAGAARGSRVPPRPKPLPPARRPAQRPVGQQRRATGLGQPTSRRRIGEKRDRLHRLLRGAGTADGGVPGGGSPAGRMGKRAGSAEGARGPREGVYMCKSEGGWKRTRGACMRMGSGAPLSGDVGQLVAPTPARRMSGARVVRVDHLPDLRGRAGERKDASRRQTAWQPASGPAAASMQLSRSRRRRRSSEAARGWGLRRGCMGRAPDVRGAHRFACLRVCGAQRVARGR